MTIDIMRAASVQATVEIDEQTVFSKALMIEDKVTLVTQSVTALAVAIGDYLTLGNENYYLNKAAEISRNSKNRALEYQFEFEAEYYLLSNKILMDEGASDFPYHQDAAGHLQLLLDNVNSINPGWTAGVVDATEPKQIIYTNESCRAALSRIAEAFGLEFTVNTREISLKLQIGTDTLHEFSYGPNNGLYTLTRDTLEDKRVATRVYGFGGTKNIGADYRDNSSRLKFTAGYLESNVANYGVREAAFTNDEIYPRRTGVITAVTNDVNNGIFELIDTSIDFDIDDHLLEGTAATIVFTSGELRGYEFEIKSYNHGTKTITYNKFQESDDYSLPNVTFKAAIGDEYKLLGIKMPQTYIDAAEAELLAATQAYLDENSVPRVTYALEIDPLFVKGNNIEIAAGDRVTVIDAELGINELIRVSEISYPLVNPNAITARVSDSVTYTIDEELAAITRDNVRVTREVDRSSIERARLNTLRARELQASVYDADGYFDTDNIRPLSIETSMLSVGQKSQNFALSGVTIQANYSGDPTKVSLSGGDLIHLEISIDGLGDTWLMAASVIQALTANESYYVYARCSKAALAGTWVVSTEPILTEDEAGFYHFWLGLLYKEADGRRDFDFTKGMTFISGENITTGKIKSLDGLNEFDLTNGTFKLGDGLEGLDWSVTQAGQLTIKGAVVSDAIMSNMVMAAFAFIDNLGVRHLKTSDTGQRVEIDGNDNTIKFYNDAEKLVLLLDDNLYQDVDANAVAAIRMADNTHETFLSKEGITAKGRSKGLLNAALGGTVEGELITGPDSILKTSAGVIGLDSTVNPIGFTYGGYFDTLKALGFHLGVKRTNISYTMTKFDTYISCNNSSAITVTLLASPSVGRRVEIKQMDADVTLDAGANVFYDDAVRLSTYLIGDNGICILLTWDGQYWQVQRLP